MSTKKGKSFGARKTKSNVNYTHYSMTRQLLEREYFDFNKSVLEPACGCCHMAYVLNDRFNDLEIYDIDNQEFYGDFYKEKRKFDYLITNPPYGKETDKFVKKSKEVVNIKFAMLLRTNFLSGETRLNDETLKGIKTIYVFSRMPDLNAEIREDGKYPTAMIVYSWIIWEIGYIGDPVLKWISNQDYVLKKGDNKCI
jgi:hypothetical protein